VLLLQRHSSSALVKLHSSAHQSPQQQAAVASPPQVEGACHLLVLLLQRHSSSALVKLHSSSSSWQLINAQTTHQALLLVDRAGAGPCCKGLRNGMQMLHPQIQMQGQPSVAAALLLRPQCSSSSRV
jgi:hypothetical protein